MVNNDGYGLVGSNGDVRLVNTIVASHSVVGIFGDVVQADRTLFYSNGENCSSGATCTGSVQGNPLFVDPQNSDYHIRNGSAAEDAGTITNVFVDFEGDRRPSGLGPDIGADEINFSIFSPFVTHTRSDG